MNRRDLLKRAFAVGAGGLLLPALEPTRRVWALDRTMIQPKPIQQGILIDGRGYTNRYIDEASLTNIIDLPSTYSGYHKFDIIHVRAVSATEWVVEPMGDSDQLPYPMSIGDAMRFFND